MSSRCILFDTGVLSSNLPPGMGAKSAMPAAATVMRSPVRPLGTKANLQMSNLAREEQAAIPHVSTDDLAGPPVMPLQAEPEKRLRCVLLWQRFINGFECKDSFGGAPDAGRALVNIERTS